MDFRVIILVVALAAWALWPSIRKSHPNQSIDSLVLTVDKAVAAVPRTATRWLAGRHGGNEDSSTWGWPE